MNEINSIDDLCQLFSIYQSFTYDFREDLTKVNLWGTAELGHQVYSLLTDLGIMINAVYDSSESRIGESFHGHTIEMPREDPLPTILCSYNMPNHIAVARDVMSNFVTAWELMAILNHSMLEWFCLRGSQCLLGEIPRFLSIENRLYNSSESTELWRQVAARHSFGLQSPSNISIFSASEEYFVPEYVSISNLSHLLDIGAFTGDTAQKFLSISQFGDDKRRVTCFEPDFRNFLELERRFRGDDRVISILASTSSSNGYLPFLESQTATSSGVAGRESTRYVPSLTIDTIWGTTLPSIVKMDIEGHEIPCLKGARESIASGKAAWAIAGYHNHNDIFEIPDFFSVNTYRFAIGSHAPRPWDSILYFSFSS